MEERCPSCEVDERTPFSTEDTSVKRDFAHANLTTPPQLRASFLKILNTALEICTESLYSELGPT